MMTELLAKSDGETLLAHTLRCVEVGLILLAQLPQAALGGPHDIGRDVLDALAVHDAGKAATGFQRYLLGLEADWKGRRHEALSAAFASTLPNISSFALFGALTHHKSIPSDGISVIYGCLPEEQLALEGQRTPMWDEMEAEWLANSAEFALFWRSLCETIGRPEWVSVAALPSSHLPDIAIDRSWLIRGRSKGAQLKAHDAAARRRAALVRGLTIAADHLASAHQIPHPMVDLKRHELMPARPRGFQERCGITVGSAILRAPTGAGKTEAALVWAQANQKPNSRLFYVLPHTASINAMYSRLGPGNKEAPGIFGPTGVGLLHSRAAASLYGMLEDDFDPCARLDRQASARTLASLAREMWFPIRVCTPHQILRHALRGKGWEYMLGEFPSACFVYDELHAYDPKLIGLTLASARLFLNWGAKCFFMSATLPQYIERLVRANLGELPMITPDPSNHKDKEILNRRRHVLSVREGNLFALTNEIIKVAERGPTLVICNHVRSAQKFFEYVKTLWPSGNVVLLHGQFNQEDRTSKEKLITGSGPLPNILVATQVVEVSLNLDFYAGFFEPAPMDALIQRAGRVNRAALRDTAQITVVTRQISGHQLYSLEHVIRTLDCIRRLQDAVSEQELVDIGNQVYGDGYVGKELEAFEEGLNNPDLTRFDDNLLAGAHRDWVDDVLDADGRIDVLPASLEARFRTLENDGLWLEANALLVPVRLAAIRASKPKPDRRGSFWIADCPYSSETGLQARRD